MARRLRPLLAEPGTGRAALFFAAIAAVTGPRFIDLDLMAQLHADPFRLLEEPRRYLHSSLVNIFVGHALGAVSPWRIRAFYLTAAALALGAILLYGHRAIADRGQRWTFFRLLALSPILHVLLFWVGKSDPFLVIAYVLLLLARQPVVVAMLSLATTLAHPEQATVVLAVHAIVQRPGRALLLASLLGWLAGIGAQQAYLAQLAIAGSPRAAWVAGRPDVLARVNLIRPASMLLLSFSWFWIPVLVYARQRPAWTLPALTGLCLAVATFGADFTRIFTLVSLPLTLHIARELALQDGAALSPWLGRLTGLAFLQVELAVGRLWDNGWTVMLLQWLGVRTGAR